jgi:hypothetical protein
METGLESRHLPLLVLECSAMIANSAMPVDNLDFAWDRPETEETLRARLSSPDHREWVRTAAWLMREARVDQVWHFLTLREVADHFSELSPLLGRRKPVWDYLLRAAHELGRI